MKKAFILWAVFLLGACAPGKMDRGESMRSGIDVQALIGPMCPVVQIGTDCPDLPYQAVLTIFDASGDEVDRFETDEEGRYRVYLEPGIYTLRPESPDGIARPLLDEQEVIVEAFKFTPLVVNYDSGIR